MPRPGDLSIKAKLSISFGVSLALVVLIGAVALVQLRDINTLATRVTEHWLSGMEVLDKAKGAMDEHRLLALRRASTTDSRQIAADTAKMSTVQAELNQSIGKFRALPLLPIEKSLLGRFADQWAAYRRSLDVVFSRLNAGDPDSARTELNTITIAAFDKASKTIDELFDLSKVQGSAVTQDLRSIYGLSLALIVGVLVVAAVVVVVAIRWFSASVTTPILNISQAMRRLAAGDKSSVAVLEEAERGDEIGVLARAVSGYRDSLDRIRQLADANVQRQRLDAALNNMAQGLCMFDPHRRLLVSNRRFTEIFKVAPDVLVAGMPIDDVMEAVHVTEMIPPLDAAKRRGSAVTVLSDGRIISIVYRPMRDGGLVATFEDITEQRRTQERIQHLAHYDALTDLPNRLTFYEQIESILVHLRRDESVAVMSLDLDHFKNVNDTLGHPIGDKLLVAAAERMRSCVRSGDVVARLGGDEFAVIQVPSEPQPSARALAERLIEEVGAPYEIDGHLVVVGASVGIAIAPNDGDKPDTLMKNADLALYRAKADGGGVYRFFEMEMDARMQERRLLEFDLRKALLKDEFELLYQPIVDIRSGKVTSCEALVRWHHPERGMVSPIEFISVAEETGLIVPLGEWVLRRACEEAVHWPKDVSVAVNLSPAQFKSGNLVQKVAEILAKTKFPPKRLELEITELVLLEKSEGAFVILRQLRDLGIRIAMDDFGTGYSSLGYLRSFPFDKIKIDKSFIEDIATTEYSVAVVRAAVGLSSSLGITTTAEGVETEEQLARLKSEGCDEIQGQLFSPPRPAAEIERFLRERATAISFVA